MNREEFFKILERNKTKGNVSVYCNIVQCLKCPLYNYQTGCKFRLPTGGIPKFAELNKLLLKELKLYKIAQIIQQ